MSERLPTQAALRTRREAAIAQLCEHYARDHIEADELERLIDRAHQSTTLAELDALLADLPALAQPTPALSPAETRSGRSDQQVAVIAVMGGAERRGAWAPAPQTYVVALMGGVVLDFRHAQLAPGVTELTVVAIMGGVEIIVPPGLHVESSGIGIMGGFGHAGQSRFPIDSTTPVLRINGLALMGGVEIRDRPHRERESEHHSPLGRGPTAEETRRLQQGEPRDGSGWTGRGG